MYKNSFSNLPILVTHELGHCLTLEHSFHNRVPYISRHVDYTTTWDTNTVDGNNDYCNATGSTYDNIMDYSYLNNKFSHKTFLKYQWDKMRAKANNHLHSTSLFSDMNVLRGLFANNDEINKWGYHFRFVEGRGYEANSLTENLYTSLKNLFSEIFR